MRTENADATHVFLDVKQLELLQDEHRRLRLAVLVYPRQADPEMNSRDQERIG